MLDKTPTYRAICFDLDGTLLPMDINQFLSRYFESITQFMVEHGADEKVFRAAFNQGVKAMHRHDATHTNKEVYWETFYKELSDTSLDYLALCDEYYTTVFPQIGDDVVPSASMVKAVSVLEQKGYPLAVLTMPLFPAAAVRARLAWAGVDPAQFVYITTYDHAHAVKPQRRYYEESLDALQVAPADVLMVGNNTLDDGAITELGVGLYLVTDYLLNPTHADLSTFQHGSADEFLAWAQTLPVCENPIHP